MELALKGKIELQKLDKLFHASTVAETTKETSLWTAFKRGSREALNAIFTDYSTILYSYGRNMTPDNALVADCIQDVFVELWTKRENLSEVYSIKFYLIKSLRRRIARRLLSDKRLLKDSYNFNDEDVEFSIEFNLIQDQTSQALAAKLNAAVADLSKRQQEAVYLKFYENMSYDELSSVMDISIKTAYNLIAKAIVILRTVIKKDS